MQFVHAWVGERERVCLCLCTLVEIQSRVTPTLCYGPSGLKEEACDKPDTYADWEIPWPFQVRRGKKCVIKATVQRNIICTYACKSKCAHTHTLAGKCVCVCAWLAQQWPCHLRRVAYPWVFMEPWTGPEPIIAIITITYETAALSTAGRQIIASPRGANYPHVAQQLGQDGDPTERRASCSCGPQLCHGWHFYHLSTTEIAHKLINAWPRSVSIQHKATSKFSRNILRKCLLSTNV